MAIALLFQQYFDTSPSNSRDWNIGLFARFDLDCDEKVFRGKTTAVNLLQDNRRRTTLTKYAVHECIAVKK
jgi:hypothetical protein